MSKIIEEKDINRLKERNEALKMGFELILVGYVNSKKYRERIKIGNYFVENLNTDNFLNNRNFSKCLIVNYLTIPWFDIQPPKMRDMTSKEAFLWCKKNGFTFCSEIKLKTDNEYLIGVYANSDNIIDEYVYMDDNGDFHKFSQIEVSE